MIKSVKWLNDNLHKENIIILDASLAAKKPRECQIPGARFFDLKGRFSDPKSTFPNMMPSASEFQAEARKLGISDNSIVIVYDNLGTYVSARIWYMFRSMGHSNTYVLDGGLPEWIRKGYETENISVQNYVHGDFTVQVDEGAWKNMNDITNNLEKAAFQLVDARSAGRFEGVSPEPRAEIKSGNIPGSCNIPYTNVLNDGKFKEPEELKKIFDFEKPLVFTCGSGITACILLLAAEIADVENDKAVYDGSWTEWATQHQLFT